MRFRVEGADRETAENTVFEIDCVTAQEARAQANAAGYLVCKVVPIAVAESPPIESQQVNCTGPCTDSFQAESHPQLVRLPSDRRRRIDDLLRSGDIYHASLEYAEATGVGYELAAQEIRAIAASYPQAAALAKELGQRRRPGRSSRAMICPHCHVKGTVRIRNTRRNMGVHGGKLSAALLTGGASILVTGLSRKENAVKARCIRCGEQWFL